MQCNAILFSLASNALLDYQVYKRGLCSRPVSVRLSRVAAEDIVKLLVRPGRPITRFSLLVPIPNSKGNPYSDLIQVHGGDRED